MLGSFTSSFSSMSPKISIVLLAASLWAGSTAAATSDRVASLYSCDQEAARVAANELLADPATVRQPALLFHAAMAERTAGRRERALFFHLAARLRGTRQALVEGGEARQVVEALNASVAPFMMPIMGSDPELGRKVMRQVLEWDSATPDPFRDKVPQAAETVRNDLAEFEAGFAQLAEAVARGVGDGSQARKTDEHMEKMALASHARRCAPGTVDATAAPAAIARIDEEVRGLVTAHPLVLRRAGGAIGKVAIASRANHQHALPHRYTVSVVPGSGDTFYAEVDVASTVGADRQLGKITPKLACLTDLWIGQREAVKDVCTSDPKALRMR